MVRIVAVCGGMSKGGGICPQARAPVPRESVRSVNGKMRSEGEGENEKGKVKKWKGKMQEWEREV